MKRWWSVVGLLVFSLNAYGEGPLPLGAVSKDFLRYTLDRISERPDRPVPLWHGLSPDETDFVRKSQAFRFTDLFVPPMRNKNEDFAYNILHQRSRIQTTSDNRSVSLQDCQMVYMEDDQVTSIVPLTTLEINRPSHKLNFLKNWRFSYCIRADHDSNPDEVLYHFHGVFGNATNWEHREAVAEIRRLWRQRGGAPMWASISMGPTGMISQRANEDRFYKIVMPYVEAQLGFSDTHRPKKRFGLGVSMGGGNLSNIVVKHPELFNAATLVCPAIAVIDPVSDAMSIAEYILRTGAWGFVVSQALKVIPGDMRDISFLYTHVDPLILGQHELGPKTPPLLIQTSSKDEFGFQEGGRLFAMLARIKGVPVEFIELEGGHCVLRPSQIVSFFKRHDG